MARWVSRAVTGAVAAGAAVCVWAPGTGAFADTNVVPQAMSASLSGYGIFGSSKSGSASVEFTVPGVTCTSTTTGIAIGASTFTNSTGVGADVFAVCDHGAASYKGELMVSGKRYAVSFTPAVGDVVFAAVRDSASGSKATLRDITQDRSQAASGSGGSPSTVIDGTVALLQDGSPVPVPQFTTIRFSRARLDMQTPGASGATAVDMQSGSDIQIATGPLKARGTAWTATFENSQ